MNLKKPFQLVRLALLAMTLGAASASAATISFTLDTTFTGTPASGAPTITLDDFNSTGSVLLTVSSFPLSGSEFIDNLYLNFNPAKNVQTLTSSGFTGPAPNGFGTLANGFPSVGGGLFDILIDWPPPGSPNFTADQTFTLTFNQPGLTAADFNFSNGSFFAAAFIQGIGPTGALTGWMGDPDAAQQPPIPPTAVPEPTSLALLGGGLLALVRKMRKQ